MWNDIVTLYIDDASIRLLVIRSKHVRKWAEIKLEPGLVKDGLVIDEIEVARLIKQLFNTQKVSTKKVILGYSGLHSMTRPGALPLLPKAMLAEAVAREARRVLPVPLDQLYLSWSNLPGSKNRTHLFMAATPRKTSDALVKTVRAAGLIPCRMAIKPLALTKALPENTAILVDMQPTEFDIVVMVEGIAQPIRTVTFPNGELSWEQKIELIASDLERTIKFYDANNAEKPLETTAIVYVSGDLIGKPELQTALANRTVRKVIPLTTKLKGSEQMDSGRYMVNIAMAVNCPSSVNCSTFPAANLNVLPDPYLPKPISLTKVVGIPSAIALAGIAIPLFLTFQNTAANISDMQNNLDTTNKIANLKTLQKQSLKKTVTELEKEVTLTKTNFDTLQRSVDSLATQQEIVNGDLAVALGWPGLDIKLNNIGESGGNMLIHGTSPSESNVLQYARYLDDTKRFSSTTVTSFQVSDSLMAQDSSNYIGFTISLQRKGK